MKQLDLSIVICNYNTRNILKNTLSSIYEYSKTITFEIIIVDDRSTDGSSEMVRNYFPKVRVWKNAKNFGYSKSCNIGTKLAKGKYILQLNSDVNFTKNTNIKLAIEFMNNNPNAGICGCKILRRDGSLDLACRHALPTIKNSLFQPFSLYKLLPKVRSTNYYMTYLPDDRIAKVGGLGAFMIVRKDLIRDIGYLDEKFFIYCEDTDYCYRAIKAGWDIYYFPKVEVVHMHGGTTKQLKTKALLFFHKGVFLFYRKHFASKNFFLLNFIVYAGISIRLIIFLTVELIMHFKQKIRKTTND